MNKLRDLKADLELCDKTTSEVWDNFSDASCEYGVYVAGYDSEYSIHPQELVATCEKVENANFIAQAREGWPHAIERALEAEALARELMEALGGLSYYVTTGEIDTPRFYKDFEVYGDLLDKSKEVLGDDEVHAGRQSMGAVEIAEQKTVGVMFKTGENKSVRRAMVVIDKLKVEGYATIKRIEMDDYHCKIVLDSGLKKLDVDIAGWPTGAITKKELGDARDAKEVLENEIQRHRD